MPRLRLLKMPSPDMPGYVRYREVMTTKLIEGRCTCGGHGVCLNCVLNQLAAERDRIEPERASLWDEIGDACDAVGLSLEAAAVRLDRMFPLPDAEAQLRSAGFVEVAP